MASTTRTPKAKSSSQRTQGRPGSLIPEWLKQRPDFVDLMAQRDTGGPVFVKEALKAAPESRGVGETRTLVKWLQSLGGVFTALGERELRMLTRCLKLKHLQPGERLEEQTDTVYVVLTGSLRVVMAGETMHTAQPMPHNQVFGFTGWFEELGRHLAEKRTGLGRRLSAIVEAVRQCVTVSREGASTGLMGRRRLPKHLAQRNSGARRASARRRRRFSLINPDYVPYAEPVVAQSSLVTPRALQHHKAQGGVGASRYDILYGVDVVCLGFDTFQRMQRAEADRQHQRVSKFLQDRALAFKNLGVARIMHLAHNLEVREIPPGQAIFKQGDALDGLYVLMKGTARVDKAVHTKEVHRVPTGAHSWAKTSRDIRVHKELRKLRVGEVFGEDCLLHARDRRTARRGAVCLSAARVRQIHRDAKASAASAYTMSGSILATSEVSAESAARSLGIALPGDDSNDAPGSGRRGSTDGRSPGTAQWPAPTALRTSIASFPNTNVVGVVATLCELANQTPQDIGMDSMVVATEAARRSRPQHQHHSNRRRSASHGGHSARDEPEQSESSTRHRRLHTVTATGTQPVQVVVLRVQNLRYLYGGRLLSSLCKLARKRYPNDLDIAQDVVRRKAADAQLRRLVGGALGPRYSHSTQKTGPSVKAATLLRRLQAENADPGRSDRSDPLHAQLSRLRRDGLLPANTHGRRRRDRPRAASGSGVGGKAESGDAVSTGGPQDDAGNGTDADDGDPSTAAATSGGEGDDGSTPAAHNSRHRSRRRGSRQHRRHGRHRGQRGRKHKHRRHHRGTKGGRGKPSRRRGHEKAVYFTLEDPVAHMRASSESDAAGGSTGVFSTADESGHNLLSMHSPPGSPNRGQRRGHRRGRRRRDDSRRQHNGRASDAGQSSASEAYASGGDASDTSSVVLSTTSLHVTNAGGKTRLSPRVMLETEWRHANPRQPDARTQASPDARRRGRRRSSASSSGAGSPAPSAANRPEHNDGAGASPGNRPRLVLVRHTGFGLGHADQYRLPLPPHPTRGAVQQTRQLNDTTRSADDEPATEASSCSQPSNSLRFPVIRAHVVSDSDPKSAPSGDMHSSNTKRQPRGGRVYHRGRRVAGHGKVVRAQARRQVATDQQPRRPRPKRQGASPGSLNNHRGLLPAAGHVATTRAEGSPENTADLPSTMPSVPAADHVRVTRHTTASTQPALSSPQADPSQVPPFSPLVTRTRRSGPNSDVGLDAATTGIVRQTNASVGGNVSALVSPVAVPSSKTVIPPRSQELQDALAKSLWLQRQASQRRERQSPAQQAEAHGGTMRWKPQPGGTDFQFR